MARPLQRLWAGGRVLAWMSVALADPVGVGPAVARRGPVPLPDGLTLATCAPSAPALADPATTATGGRLLLVLRIRRNRVALVTTAAADPAVAPLAPCFERELAAAAWTLRRGRVELPIVVAPPTD